MVTDFFKISGSNRVPQLDPESRLGILLATVLWTLGGWSLGNADG